MSVFLKKISVLTFFGIYLISKADATLPWSWEVSDGQVTVESVDVILEDEDEDLNFPWMCRFDNGTIWLRYHAGTHTVSEHSESLISLDNGLTWTTPTNTIRCLDTAELPGGVIKSAMNVYPKIVMKRHTINTYTWADPTADPVITASYCDLPWKSTFLCHRSMVVLDDGTLIATGYGKVEGEDKTRAFCIKSSDNGSSWSFLSTIAYDPAVGGMEGYNEPVLEKLADGSLLCVLRTNAFQPARQARSFDDGVTWTEPIAMPDNLQGVAPELHLLSNGVLMATIGTRPGVDLYVDFTGTGDNWRKVDWPFFSGDGYYCSYTSFVEIEPGKVMFVVCQSDFYTVPEWQFDGLNTIKRAYITVSPIEPEKVSWDHVWDADEMPERFLAGSVFLHTPYVPADTDLVREVAGGVYTTQTKCLIEGQTTPNANSMISTRSKHFDPSVPSTIEFRYRADAELMSYINFLIISQKGTGDLGFNFRLSHQVLNRYDGSQYFVAHKDAEGWSVFRVLTNVSEGNLTGADIYYKDGQGNWIFGMSVPITPNMSVANSKFSFGDGGSNWAGEWSIDYLRWSSGNATLGEIGVVPLSTGSDLDDDGDVDCEDFAILADQWSNYGQV